MANRTSMCEKKKVAQVFKLSEICLQTICKNSNRFIYVFKHSNDDKMKRSLLFLQKKFSNDLMSIFTNKEASYCLENIFFDCLLNEYLKELNTSIFKEEDWEDALHYLKDIGQSFEKVTFQCRHPSKTLGHQMIFGKHRENRLNKSRSEGFLQKFVHVLIPHLTNVSSLTMHASTRFTDETLKMICSTCKQLKDLSFVGQRKVTREELESLCPDDQSTKLNLKSLNWPFREYRLPAISETGIIHLLKNMRSLELIEYYHLSQILYKLHIGDLRDGSIGNVQKYNLTSLEIDVHDNFGDNTKAFKRALDIVVELCPALKKLSLVGVADEKHMLIVLPKFSDLVDLQFIGQHDGGKPDLDEVLRVTGKQLKVLFLKHCRVSVPSLLASCPRLEVLTLNCIARTDCLDHPNLKPLYSLNNLSLNGSFHATAESLDLLLLKCPKLEELTFLCFEPLQIDQEVNGAVGRFCERSECLQRLTFECCDPKDPGLLQHIATTCRPLKTLVVAWSASISLSEIQAVREIARASLQIQFRSDRTRSEHNINENETVGLVIDYFGEGIDVDDSYYDTDDGASFESDTDESS